MKIVELREISVPLQGEIANSLVNFSAHTVSLVAVITDVVRNGKPVSASSIPRHYHILAGQALSLPCICNITTDSKFDLLFIKKICSR